MKLLTTLALTLPLLAGTACAQPAAGDLNREQVEKIVYEYLMENPEVIRDVMIELEAKEDREMLKAVAPSLYEDKRDISIGPENAKVTIVEFFDYNCGYCKQSTEWVANVLDKHPKDVRVIFKELPILDGRTKTSRNAAKAALAAGRQGKYLKMHLALMNERSLTPARVEALAKKAGLDVEMWKKDMEDEMFDKQLEDTLILANRIPPLNGTPFFVIGEEFIAGANVAKLQEMLDAALES